MNAHRRISLVAWTFLALFVSSGQVVGNENGVAPLVNEGSLLAVRASKVVSLADLPEPVVFNPGVVLIRGSKIAAVGRPEDVEIPDGTEVIDVGNRWLVPGLVELHCHIAGSGINDMVYLSNPDLELEPGVTPENNNLKNALAGGVTSALFIPGSGTNMGGHGIMIKTAGATLDEMKIRNPGSLKIAQAGNPERYYYGVTRSYMNWNTRNTLERGLEYHQAWTAYEEGERAEKPDFDPTFETLRGLFRKEYPVSLHTQWYQVALESITMLKRDLGLDIFIDHGTFEAWRLGRIAVQFDVPVINGPRQLQFDRQNRQIQGNCWGWWKEGVRELGVNTDSGVIPQHELTYQAAMAVRFGWESLPALRGMTIVPARTIGLAHRLGSIEVGKDADLAAWTSDPVDPSSACELTIVDGKIAYDVKRDGRRF